MATTTNVTTTYAGEAAAGYIMPCLLSPETVGNVTVHENVKHKMVLRTLDVTDVLADATCDFTPTGTVDLDEVILETKPLEVNLQQCKSDYINSWEVLEMRASRGLINDDELPATLSDHITGLIMGRVGESFENLIWNGVAGAGSFVGFMFRIDAAKGGVAEVLPGAAIDATNVIAQLQAMYDKIPDCVFQKRDVKFYIPIHVEKAYQTAISNLGYLNVYTVDEKPLNFQGIPMVVAPGMLSKDIIAASESDLHYGVNLLSDELEIRLLDMAENDGSKNVRFIANFEVGTQITNDTNIVWGEFVTP